MKRKITSNQILGGLVGICAVIFLFAEKNILFHTQILSGQVNSGVLDLITGLLSLLVFFLIVRRFTKNKNHGLVRYFLSSCSSWYLRRLWEIRSRYLRHNINNSNPIPQSIACSLLRNKILLRKEGDLSCERSCFILFSGF